MVQINMAAREITLKLVYYGPALSGKTTNLQKLHEMLDGSARGKMVIYKMGQQGAITLVEGDEFRTGIYPVTAVKPNGAGDSFLAGLLASNATGHDLRTAVLRGSACASIVVSKPGCAGAMPTTTELDAFLASYHGPTQI